MTIRTKLNDGHKTLVFTYRNIFRPKNYSELVQSFYGAQDGFKWGIMEQLKGKDRIMCHEFGKRG